MKIAYHKIRFFLSWIRFYIKHIISAFSACRWAIKSGLKLPFKEYLDLFKWNSWSRYKKTHHYYITKNKYTSMIAYDQFNEFFKTEI